MDTYSPGETAERTGLSLETLRYYERIGLIQRVGRDSRGRRAFTAGDIEWLGVLHCLRRTGMPIRDMVRFATLALADDRATVAERIQILEEHDASVVEQIAVLEAQRDVIEGKIAWYRSRLH